jgi:hypothetical protein
MGIEAVMIAAAVVSAGSAIYSGVQQKHAADTNAELARREGNQQQDAAVAQAEKIRKAGRAAAGQANAAMAASGVSIGEGTPIRINEQIYADSESDAYSTLLTGTRRQQSANDQAGMLQYEGNTARTAGYLNAGASLLSSGSSYGKWQTSQAKGGGK